MKEDNCTATPSNKRLKSMAHIREGKLIKKRLENKPRSSFLASVRLACKGSMAIEWCVLQKHLDIAQA